MRECYSDVKQADEGCLSSAQDILRNSTDVLRRIIAPVDENWRGDHCRCFPLEDHIWWVSSGHDGNISKKKQCIW